MTDLTPEQNEAAIILKNIWNQEKNRLGFTQAAASKAMGISQPNISGFLNGKTPLGPVAVAKFSGFLNVRPSVIMPSLQYMERMGEGGSPSRDAPVNYAPLLTKEEAEQWLNGSLPIADIADWKTKVPLFDNLIGRRCFAVLATGQDAAANKSVQISDIIICDPSRTPKPGELAYYNILGDWVLGSLQRHAGRLVLTFDTFEPHPLENEAESRISSVVATIRLTDAHLK